MGKKKRYMAALLTRFVKSRRGKTWHVKSHPNRTACGIVGLVAAEAQLTVPLLDVCRNCRDKMGANKSLLTF